VRWIGANGRPDGRGDPRPGIGGEAAPAGRVEPVDGGDQAQRARLHRLVEGVATQAEMVGPQSHEPEALTDEIVSRATIACSSSQGERKLTIPIERWLGQQATRQGIHVTSVDAPRTRGWG
jgi:hypothetical protein